MIMWRPTKSISVKWHSGACSNFTVAKKYMWLGWQPWTDRDPFYIPFGYEKNAYFKFKHQNE